MRKVTVYKVKIYDVTADESRVSRRMATEKGAAIMRGEIIRETGIEIDADRLEPGQEWTPRDFVPRLGIYILCFCASPLSAQAA